MSEFEINKNQLKQTPEVTSSEELAGAVASIPSLGAAAVATQAEAPPSLGGGEPGFISRRWQSFKDGFKKAFDPRESEAGQALVEAGETFSKWEVARATVYDMVNSASITGSTILKGLSQPFIQPRGRSAGTKPTFFQKLHEDAPRKAERFDSGISNPLLRKKMANALRADEANPVNKHLTKYNRRHALKEEVRKTAERKARWEADIPRQRTANMMGGLAVGVSIIPAYLAAKGIIDPDNAKVIHDTLKNF
jgi:hypothetical protein